MPWVHAKRLSRYAAMPWPERPVSAANKSGEYGAWQSPDPCQAARVVAPPLGL